MRIEITHPEAIEAPRLYGGAGADAAGASVIPLRRGSSPVARALVAARKERGQTLRTASERSGLPVRYLAAFEKDTAPLVFRSPVHAEAFLAEYARYLGVDPVTLSGLSRVRRHRSAERAPPLWASRGIRPPGKGGRPPRRIVVLAVALLAGIGLSVRMVVSDGPGSRDVRLGAGPLTEAAAIRARPPELPRGGRRLFPDYRVVALYGSPLTHRLGRLGLGPPSFAAEALMEQARHYEGRRPVLPALELVSTVASPHAGADGSYTNRLSERVIEAYLAEVRGVRGLLIIDVQPGPQSFPDEVARYERLLRQPDVGLALDPEWRVDPGEVPGQEVGSVHAGEVNEVIDYLAEIVRRYDLPQKLLVVHQFARFMVEDRASIHAPPEVAVTFDIDGVGGRQGKSAAYQDLSRGPGGTFLGIKLYYAKDDGLMAPWEVLALDPEPDLVIYQ
ncbi:MAG: helix-turn-helix domain-containing protein [Actinomycetota bacterium]